ncbi:hypothetical protein Bbelb_017120 [Branchiostoma belcheri]|nr:hypothetical protein Bbelb_017120 [Branchiostoma belcheri]
MPGEETTDVCYVAAGKPVAPSKPYNETTDVCVKSPLGDHASGGASALSPCPNLSVMSGCIPDPWGLVSRHSPQPRQIGVNPSRFAGKTASVPRLEIDADDRDSADPRCLVEASPVQVKADAAQIARIRDREPAKESGRDYVIRPKPLFAKITMFNKFEPGFSRVGNVEAISQWRQTSDGTQLCATVDQTC